MVRAMTTLKPHLVRADTIDLQDQNAPSAKDHTKQPNHGSSYGYVPVAPHQAQTLRRAEHEAYQDQHMSPRASEDRVNGGLQPDQHFYDDLDDDQDDEHHGGHPTANGAGYNGQDPDEGDGVDSHDEDMDDDLMDKISSSPSIEDGKYSLSLWPPRVDSADLEASPALQSKPTRGDPMSSSPFASTPEHFPLRVPHIFHPASHHGEYLADSDPIKPEYNIDHHQPEVWESPSPLTASEQTSGQTYLPLSESQEFRRYLLPLHDPLLAETVEDYANDFIYDEEDEWEDMEPGPPEIDYSSDDDTVDFHFTSDDRFIDSGWGGECLREIEDIDFEFVYALHTFVATVEGQANATKGDTMVLLDDSNSYWWLVRVVKDGSIGYLPAEHIETPTERLARLNKHRNVDLSASMLGDNPEKSKNPLKKAMRRRNAKTVQFAPPTYYEPSDYEYSDEDDEPEGDDARRDQLDADDADEHDTDEVEAVDVSNKSEPQETREPVAVSSIKPVVSNDNLKPNPLASAKPQEAIIESRDSEDSLQRSRKGVVRNTDSFFKDDTAETKKISLTPRLLRGDSDAAVPTEAEVRQRPSLETFDKMVGLDDKSKEKDKKEKKEKKGMLSGLFKRKKGSATEEPEKGSEDARQSPGSKDSSESLSRPETGPGPGPGPERKPSKLQKTPPVLSPKTSPTEARHPQHALGPAPPAPTGPAPNPPAMRGAESDAQRSQQQSQPTQVNRFPSLTEKRSIFTPITAALKSTPTTTEPSASFSKPIHSKRSKERFAIDESDSDVEERDSKPEQQEQSRATLPLQKSTLQPFETTTQSMLSEVQPPTRSVEHSVPLHPAPLSSSSPLPQNPTPSSDADTTGTSKPSPSTATHTPSTSRSTPTWSDASLRHYMENSQDIKDLLVIVHDKSNVTPVTNDHPLMQDLFSNERSKLADMQSQLDNMLMGWISRKNAMVAT